MIPTPGITNQSIATGAVDEATDQIRAQTSAIPILSSVGGTLTADGNEQTLYIDNKPLGGDTIAVKVYHRLSDAGTLKILAYHTWTGADGGLANGEVLDSIELVPNRHGWKLTLQQTAGTNRDYPWELFMEI